MHNGLAQTAVVQHALDVVIVHTARDVDVELGVDVQRLCGAAFVFEDANAGVQGKARNEDTASRHNELKAGRS